MSTQYIKDRQGKLIGRIDENSTATLYYDAQGRYLGKYFNNQTVDSYGRLVGQGNQGMGLIFEAN